MTDFEKRSRISEHEKRPLFFISGEDFYFLAYSILLSLEFFGGSAKRIKDHRKFAYLIEFMSDDRLVGILKRSQIKKIANPVDKELLFSSFSQAEIKKREIYKILFSLEKRGLVSMQRTDVAEILDVSLISKELPADFFISNFFHRERTNAEELKKLIQRLSILNFDTLLERLYTDRGVSAWAY